MIFKPTCRFQNGCASYLFGCGGVGAAVDVHEDDDDAAPSFAAQ